MVDWKENDEINLLFHEFKNFAPIKRLKATSLIIKKKRKGPNTRLKFSNFPLPSLFFF